MSQHTPRIAIYGRHSTIFQNQESSNDQAAACRHWVERLQGVIVGTYLDPAESGYRRDRQGLQRMFRDIENGKIDIVVSESLDRIARDGEDVHWVGKKLNYHCVHLHTISEGHVDEIKFAIAGLLGALFLKSLREKVLRGMEAAVVAGKFAGGRTYGYKRVIKLNDKNELIPGLLEIDEAQATIIQRIYREFAAGLSSIKIATRLNQDGISGPSGNAWNASTIRGDPKKYTGILNNHLYRGELIWKRREWRRNPDSEKRERQYRLRDHSEWIHVDVPDMSIISEELWDQVQSELQRRSQSPKDEPPRPQDQRRKKHLLSGILKCGVCGANYTISGKDYYRCAGQKERGTCTNLLSVRKSAVEAVTLSNIKRDLLTETDAKQFKEEFERELQRLNRANKQQPDDTADRLRQVEAEISNIAQNCLSGVISPTLAHMLSEREREKAVLETRLTKSAVIVRPPSLPSPADLVQIFQDKIENLESELNDPLIKAEACSVLAQLIESVIIFPEGEAEVSASAANLISFATNAESPRRVGAEGCSITVVAGVGFEPTTFRL